MGREAVVQSGMTPHGMIIPRPAQSSPSASVSPSASTSSSVSRSVSPSASISPSHSGSPSSSASPSGGGGGLLDWGGTQYETLEMIQPRNDLPTNHRMKFAYPGLLYEVRVACVGGVYPYLYEITSGAGSGMTIDADTGVISWPNPTTNATPTVRVTDTLGSTVSETWTITVSTSNWVFVDPVSGTTFGDGGTGSIGNPFRTLEDVFEHTGAGKRAYLMSGSYNFTGITHLGALCSGPGQQEGDYIELIASSMADVWIAYPGATPVINFGGQTCATGCVIGWSGETLWMEGLECRNGFWKFFNGGGGSNGGGTFWRNEFHEYAIGSSNSSFMMWNHAGPPRVYAPVVQENNFHNEDGSQTPSEGLGILLYDNTRALIEANTYQNMTSTFSPKAGNDSFTFRGNTVVDCHYALSSNFNVYELSGNNEPASGEICFNNYIGPWDFDDPNSDIGCVEFGPTWGVTVDAVHVYRNTLNGPVSFCCLTASQGPVVMFRNVIVNSYSSTTPYTHMREVPGFGSPDWGQVDDVENLKGVVADGVINQSTGLLQGSYRTTYLYYRGHEVP